MGKNKFRIIIYYCKIAWNHETNCLYLYTIGFRLCLCVSVHNYPAEYVKLVVSVISLSNGDCIHRFGTLCMLKLIYMVKTAIAFHYIQNWPYKKIDLYNTNMFNKLNMFSFMEPPHSASFPRSAFVHCIWIVLIKSSKT